MAHPSLRIKIPLGLMDAHADVDSVTGDVRVSSSSPLPKVLADVVAAVLETWMIDWPWDGYDEAHGTLMVAPQAWLEYFGHRFAEEPA